MSFNRPGWLALPFTYLFARTLGGLVRYFARLGSLGFGGPIALCGFMHRDLVEKRD